MAVELSLLVYSLVYSSSRRGGLFDRRQTSMEIMSSIVVVVVERTVIEVVPILTAHWLELMKTLKHKKKLITFNNLKFKFKDVFFTKVGVFIIVDSSSLLLLLIFTGF